MKVLIANCVYKRGSTGKIVYDTQRYLEQMGHDTMVCYGNFRTQSDLASIKFCSDFEVRAKSILTKLGGLQFKGGFISTHKLIKIIQTEHPDVVHLHCMNGYCVNLYALLKYLGINKIPTLVTHHAEFYYTGSCSHAFDCDQWKENQCRNCPKLRFATNNVFFADAHEPWIKMKRAFEFFDFDKLKFSAVSPWVKDRSLKSPLVKDYECITVMNGVETSVFHYRDDFDKINSTVLNSRSHIVFFSSASFRPNDTKDIKGGKYILGLSKLMQDTTFIVAALDYDSSIDLPDNIHLWGSVTDQDELASLYSYADVTVVLSKRETFSMVTAESLCCGTPVVGFAAGGPESIAIKKYSSFIKERNPLRLKDEIYKMIDCKFDKKSISEKAKIIYSKENMAQSYLTIYNSLAYNNDHCI